MSGMFLYRIVLSMVIEIMILGSLSNQNRYIYVGAFTFDRTRFDEEQNREVAEKVSLNVPMLAVVKVPALSVADVCSS